MNSLLFVTTVGQPRGESATARKQIRKQAMSRAAAKRRERGGYGQVNKLQYPVSVIQKDIDNRIDTRKDVLLRNNTTTTCLARSPSCTGYERLRIRYGVDLLDLSALTNFHVSQGTVASLSHEPFLLKHIVRSRQWSYLDYLPRCTEANAALDKASQCVAARLHEFLHCPSEPTSPRVLRIYASALRALQAELEDSKACLSPETLCATQLLGLYELLRVSNSNAWTCHSMGASALIKLRGPGQYKTDFEKGLLLSQLGQIFHEALAIQDECFLERNDWHTTLDAIIAEQNPFSDRGAFTIRMWKSILPLPGYMGQVVAAVRSRGAVESPLLAELLADLRQTTLVLLQETCGSPCALRGWQYGQEDPKLMESIGLLLTTLAIVSRLLFALDTARWQFESEAQDVARQILRTNMEAIAIHPRAELYMALKVHVAQTILATGPSWLAVANSGQEGLVSSELLLDWFTLVGWKT